MGILITDIHSADSLKETKFYSKKKKKKVNQSKKNPTLQITV